MPKTNYGTGKGEGDSKYRTDLKHKNAGDNTAGKGTGDASFQTTFDSSKVLRETEAKGAGDPAFKTKTIAGQGWDQVDSRHYQVKRNKKY